MVNAWKDKKKKRAQFVLFEYKRNIKSQGVFFYLWRTQPWPQQCPSPGRWWWGRASGWEGPLFYLKNQSTRRTEATSEWKPPGQFDRRQLVATYFIHHFDHLFQLVGADVGAVGEAEVEEHPLAKEVFALGRLVVVVDQWKRTAQRRPADRSGPFLFDHCGEERSADPRQCFTSLWHRLRHRLASSLDFTNTKVAISIWDLKTVLQLATGGSLRKKTKT